MGSGLASGAEHDQSRGALTRQALRRQRRYGRGAPLGQRRAVDDQLRRQLVGGEQDEHALDARPARPGVAVGQRDQLDADPLGSGGRHQQQIASRNVDLHPLG